ncbi:MarR family transcriptional regulator [Micromonospora sp. NBC_00898]|uniref:MarR family winged helix-turn-helix transcriptional regulator n=1 Tax=Micromonospora sp. NBC_00898 TaxID=2975981 RepID=UPI0038666C4A|nr:MarR family transcriptional regulator [Micromonospora sp. NBC_00898]
MRRPADDVTPARFTRLPSWLLTQTAQHAGRLVADGMAAVDGRGYHYRVLAALDEFGPASQAALGRRSGVHLSDLVAALNELADRGFVERAPDPADRRRNIITITSAGHRQLALLEGQLTRVQDALLAPLEPDERAQLVGLLTRVLDHQVRGAGSPQTPTVGS